MNFFQTSQMRLLGVKCQAFSDDAKLIRVGAVQVHNLVQNDGGGGDESARGSHDLT